MTIAEILQNAYSSETDEKSKKFYQLVFERLSLEQVNQSAGEGLENWLSKYYGEAKPAPKDIQYDN